MQIGPQDMAIHVSNRLQQVMVIIPVDADEQEVKIRGPHHARQKEWDFPKKADIPLAYGTDSATTHFRYGVCTRERQECHALLPTDRGTDEAGLYRAQVGSQLLAGPTRTPGATRSGLEGAGGSA